VKNIQTELQEKTSTFAHHSSESWPLRQLGLTPLIKHNHITLVEQILDKGYVVKSHDYYTSIYSHREKILRLLLLAEKQEPEKDIYHEIVERYNAELTVLFLKCYKDVDQHLNYFVNIAACAEYTSHLEYLLGCVLPPGLSLYSKIKLLRKKGFPPTHDLLSFVVSTFDYRSLKYIHKHWKNVTMDLSGAFSTEEKHHSLTEQFLDLLLLAYPSFFSSDSQCAELIHNGGLLALNWLEHNSIPYDTANIVHCCLLGGQTDCCEFLIRNGYKLGRTNVYAALWYYDAETFQKFHAIAEEDIKRELECLSNVQERQYKTLKWCLQNDVISKEKLAEVISVSHGHVESVMHWFCN
jgi:hypothetical protein